MFLDKGVVREGEERVAEQTLVEPLDGDVRDGGGGAVERVVLAAARAVAAAVGDVHVGEVVAARALRDAAAHDAHEPLDVPLPRHTHTHTHR